MSYVIEGLGVYNMYSDTFTKNEFVTKTKHATVCVTLSEQVKKSYSRACAQAHTYRSVEGTRSLFPEAEKMATGFSPEAKATDVCSM